MGKMTTSGPARPLGEFDVGVAIVAADGVAVGARDHIDGSPVTPRGYEETLGAKHSGAGAGRLPVVVVKGRDAVRAAGEAIAGEIGEVSYRIAEAIEAREVAPSQPGTLGLESVQVSFGITLIGGVQAFFTAQAESSVQVTITLTRAGGGGQPPSA